MKKQNTSWQPVNRWYNKSVGSDGHYYHQHVVLPNLLRLLHVSKNDKILDIGCGQGVLSRKIPTDVYYQGIDIATGLIQAAKKQNKNAEHHFAVGDATKKLPIQRTDFSKAVIMLALQNMETPEKAIENISKRLITNGKLVIVLNHPSFRIPRHSHWGIDETQKIQYRRIDRYMSDLKIPIVAHPGDKNSAVTWSFHRPLSSYSNMLQENGFVIETIEEWTSDKKSVGQAKKMENRGREEFPLFLTIVAMKK